MDQNNNEKVMEYKKPEILAVNEPAGSYSAGCPLTDSAWCVTCERIR